MNYPKSEKELPRSLQVSMARDPVFLRPQTGCDAEKHPYVSACGKRLGL